jgi:hypothetical protein
LFTWGAAVTVVAPEGLRVAMREMASVVAGRHAATTNVGAPG